MLVILTPTSRMVEVMVVVVQVTQGRPSPAIVLQVQGLVVRLGVACLPFPLAVGLISIS